MTRLRRLLHRRDLRGDSGMSLAELVVYSVLLGVVLVIIGSLLIRTLFTQRDVRGRAEAGNTAQVTFSSLERTIRNARGAEVDLDGDLLVVLERVAVSTSDANRWRCVGYYVDDSAGVIRRVQSTTGGATLAVTTAGSDSAMRTQAATWPAIVEDAGAIAGVRAFGPGDSVYAKNTVIQISLRAEVGAGKQPVELNSSVSLRPQSGASLTCY